MEKPSNSLQTQNFELEFSSARSGLRLRLRAINWRSKTKSSTYGVTMMMMMMMMSNRQLNPCLNEAYLLSASAKSSGAGRDLPHYLHRPRSVEGKNVYCHGVPKKNS